MGKSKIYHGKNLRKGRFSEQGRAYVLTAVTYQRRPLFDSPAIGKEVVNEFKEAHGRSLAETLTWVVMPDHFHWLIVLGATSLSRLMQRVKSCSAIAINKSLDGQGQIWQKGYYDHALRDEEDIETVGLYILNNPVRKGLVSEINEYELWGAVWLHEDVFLLSDKSINPD